MAIVPTEKIFFEGKECYDVNYEGHECVEAWYEVDGALECVWRKGNGKSPDFFIYSLYRPGGYSVTSYSIQGMYFNKDKTEVGWGAVSVKYPSGEYVPTTFGGYGVLAQNDKLIAIFGGGSSVSGIPATFNFSFDGYRWFNLFKRYFVNNYNRQKALDVVIVNDGFVDFNVDNKYLEIHHLKVTPKGNDYELVDDVILYEHESKLSFFSYSGKVYGDKVLVRNVVQKPYYHVNEARALFALDMNGNLTECQNCIHTETYQDYVGSSDNYPWTQINDNVYNVFYFEGTSVIFYSRERYYRRTRYDYDYTINFCIKTSTDLIHWSDDIVLMSLGKSPYRLNYRGWKYDPIKEKHYIFLDYADRDTRTESLTRFTLSKTFVPEGYTRMHYDTGWALSGEWYVMPHTGASAPEGKKYGVTFNSPSDLQRMRKNGKWVWSDFNQQGYLSGDVGYVIDSMDGTPPKKLAFSYPSYNIHRYRSWNTDGNNYPIVDSK